MGTKQTSYRRETITCFHSDPFLVIRIYRKSIVLYILKYVSPFTRRQNFEQYQIESICRRQINPFVAMGETMGFCGWLRSRSDYTECVV